MAEGSDHQDVQPGGSPSRGPNPQPGGEEEPGGLVPPYAGRSTDSSGPSAAALRASVEQQLAQTKTGRDGATASPADEQPATDDDVTDDVPDSPKGVGTSGNRSAEDLIDKDGIEPGREHHETQGDSERRAGTSTPRDVTGINPQES